MKHLMDILTISNHSSFSLESAGDSSSRALRTSLKVYGPKGVSRVSHPNATPYHIVLSEWESFMVGYLLVLYGNFLRAH